MKGLERQTVRVGGLDLAVHTAGEGPPVLLVHGFPDDHEVWERQVPALLSAGYRVIAPDTRGCGESAMPAREKDYRLDLLVADLVAVLDHFGIAKVGLVGHDWGAVIGWHLAIAHPERIDRYAALSVGHPMAYQRGGLMQKLKGYYVLIFQLRGIAERLAMAGNWRALRVMLGSSEEADRVIAKLSRPGRLTAGMRYYRANLDLVWRKRAPCRGVPVMGVFSDGDRFLTERQMRDSARYVDEPFRYELVNGAGHWLQLDAPGEVNALLLDFLGEDDKR